MTTCPHCGRNLGHSETARRSSWKPLSRLEAFIKTNQPRMRRVVNLKREIARHFGVKKFADLPHDKYPEALEFVRAKVEYYTVVWGANEILESAVPKFLLPNVPGATYDLAKQLERKLREECGDKYWSEMDPKEAVDAIHKAIGDQNVWEYAYRHLEDSPTLAPSTP